ncbi:hypothetical protein [Nocardia rhizosphaerae]|uniref:Uncharacterized protein n=1 Tax=Nocardia rhizosphaerae TaxID=1691571 RepID=A0ABV8LEM5_9NOCA
MTDTKRTHTPRQIGESLAVLLICLSFGAFFGAIAWLLDWTVL